MDCYSISSDLQSLTDADNDGWCDTYDNSGGAVTSGTNLPEPDTDGDGIVNSRDIDSDNDGIPDILEAGGVDADGDGFPESLVDTDADGIIDEYDPDFDGIFGTDVGQSSNPLILTSGDNGDGTPVSYVGGDADQDDVLNHLDLDADNDGIADIIEVGGVDTDNNGLVDTATDTDQDGYADTFDEDNSGTSITSTGADSSTDGRPDSYEDDADSDVVPNFLDADADNDGLPDNLEAQPTASYTAAGSTDTDGDGILNEYEAAFLSPTNTDSNGEADYLDSDSDGDGYLDRDEAWDAYDDGDAINDESCNADADGDGILNCYDANDGDNTNVTISRTPPNDNGFNGTDYTGSQTSTGTGPATIYPNNGGVLAEPDWRDASGCTVSPQLVYPITGTDNLFNESLGKHEINPNATGKIRATGYCEDLITAGWNYYYSPLNSDQLIFAINHGANTTPIDYIELRRANVSDRQSTSGSQGYFVLGRDWFVKTIDDAALTANVNIRFYFDPTDSTSFYSEASDFATDEGGVLGSVTWFKVDNSWEGTDIDPGTGLSGLAGYTTLTPASYGEESGLHYVQFDNLSSFSGGGAIVPVTGVLPVELLSFQGKQVNDQIILNWVTATEVNSASFELQRFSDTFFSKIGEVEAAGLSSELIQYEFVDRSASFDQRSIIYRMKQIDLDGSFTFSPSIEVLVDQNAISEKIRTYPNPATDELTISYNSLLKGEINLSIYDLNGRVIHRETRESQVGVLNMKIDVARFGAGIYLLALEQEGVPQKLIFQIKKKLSQPHFITILIKPNKANCNINEIEGESYIYRSS